MKSGWTMAINIDQNHGEDSTGDHENYFQFLKNAQSDETIVFNIDGEKFTDCTKKAVYVRSKEEQRAWFTYTTAFTFLFSKNKKYYHGASNEMTFTDSKSFSRLFLPEYG